MSKHATPKLGSFLNRAFLLSGFRTLPSQPPAERVQGHDQEAAEDYRHLLSIAMLGFDDVRGPRFGSLGSWTQTIMMVGTVSSGFLDCRILELVAGHEKREQCKDKLLEAMEGGTVMVRSAVTLDEGRCQSSRSLDGVGAL